MDCHLNPFSRTLLPGNGERFSSVIYCFQQCKQKEIVKRRLLRKKLKLNMQTGMKSVSLEPSRAMKLIAVRRETSRWQRTFLKWLIARVGKTFSFVNLPTDLWSFVEKLKKPNKSTADWRVEILRDSRSKRVPDYRSFHDPSSSRHRRLYVEFYGCSSVSDAKYHLWKFSLSDSALLKQLVKVPPRNRCSAMHHKTPLLQPPQKNKFA